MCARRVCIDGILECRGPMVLYVDDVVVGYDMSQSLTQRIGRFDSKLGTILAAAQMC